MDCGMGLLSFSIVAVGGFRSFGKVCEAEIDKPLDSAVS